MKKNYTTFFFILSIIATTLAILLFVFFLKVIKNKNEHTSAVLATLGERTKEKENAIIFAGKVAEVKAIEDGVDSHLVDTNKIDTFVNYLESIGSDFGSSVSVTSIEVPPKSKNTVAVKLSIKGKFDQVMETVAYLENIPYQIEVTGLSVIKNTESQSGVAAVPVVSKDLGWQADVAFNILSIE